MCSNYKKNFIKYSFCLPGCNAITRSSPYINKHVTLRQETNTEITLIFYGKHSPMKLKWKQYTSCGQTICGIFIMSSDCTGSSKIKRRNILQPNSLSINTVTRSSLHPPNPRPSSCCGKLKKKREEKETAKK